MNTEKSIKPITLSEAHAQVAWFTSGTHNGKYKGMKMGVVLVTTELGKYAKLGVAATPLGGGDPEIDAAYIFHDGADIDVEVAELIMERHEGTQIYLD